AAVCAAAEARRGSRCQANDNRWDDWQLVWFKVGSCLVNARERSADRPDGEYRVGGETKAGHSSAHGFCWHIRSSAFDVNGGRAHPSCTDSKSGCTESGDGPSAGIAVASNAAAGQGRHFATTV